jgi:hypothetical protein
MMMGMAARSGGINTIVSRLFYTDKGSMLFSGILGLALALLFSRVCKDKKCLIIHAPPNEEIKDSIYQLNGECYKYNPVVTECDSDN